MKSRKLKKSWKDYVLDLVLAFIPACIAYFTYKFFSPPPENLVFAFFFILTLILIKVWE